MEQLFGEAAEALLATAVAKQQLDRGLSSSQQISSDFVAMVNFTMFSLSLLCPFGIIVEVKPILQHVTAGLRSMIQTPNEK